MAIVGVLVNSLSIGAINTSASATLKHNFGPSSVWGQPTLQGSGQGDTPGGADSFVSQFVDAGGTHNVSFIAVFANKCTSITYTLKVNEANSRVLCVTQFFG